jgi:chemotaxis protein MotB
MRSRQRLRTDHMDENFWPSFTDMISTIAIILFFLILIIFIRNIIIGKEYDLAQSQLNVNRR